MKSEYEKAMTKSYAGQGNTFQIPKSEEITEMELGFQPLGMSVYTMPGGPDIVAVVAYYEPAILMARLVHGATTLEGTVSWIRGVDHGIESVRLFTGHPTFGDKDRAQCVVLNLDDTI